MPLTIAHLSDVHLAPIEGFGPRYWNLKRGLGFANWWGKRRHVHLAPVLARIVADVGAKAPDHVVVTGDLVNVGLPREIERAAQWLACLGAPDRVTVVPGNHDIYVRLAPDEGVGRWRDYMASDGPGAVLVGRPAAGFPFVRRLGDVALVGLNSAVPTPPGVAKGRLGRQQIEALHVLLQRLGAAGLFRLVLIHHPPLPGQTTRLRALADAGELATVLERDGAELVVHGHNHQPSLAWWGSGGRAIPVVGVASGSAGRVNGREPLAQYNLYRIARNGERWQIELTRRGLAEPGGLVVDIERRGLVPPSEEALRPTENFPHTSRGIVA